MKALQQLPAKWRQMKQALSFTNALIKSTYGVYLNHTKVIHHRDGYPVYSLSTPALYSEPAANLLARTLYRTIQNRNTPNMMSFAVNDVCNAHCEHCSFFEGLEDRSRSVLTTEQARSIIRQGQDLGVSVLNFVGGEPLLRDDLPDIIRSVDRSLTTTVLFTNGALLRERVGELRKAGLDSVYVSIDSADPATHDRFRGSPGLFDRAVAGIKEAIRLGCSTGISCTLTPESFARGEFDRLLEFARSIGVHEVLVFDAMPTGRYSVRDDLVDNEAWVEDLVQAAVPYNRDLRYPGVLVWAYTAGYRAVGCSCGTSYFYISPYGDLMSCDFNHAKFGNAIETPLYRLWDELTSLDEFHQSKWGGCKVKDSTFRDSPYVRTGPEAAALPQLGNR